MKPCDCPRRAPWISLRYVLYRYGTSRHNRIIRPKGICWCFHSRSLLKPADMFALTTCLTIEKIHLSPICRQSRSPGCPSLETFWGSIYVVHPDLALLCISLALLLPSASAASSSSLRRKFQAASKKDHLTAKVTSRRATQGPSVVWRRPRGHSQPQTCRRPSACRRR